MGSNEISNSGSVSGDTTMSISGLRVKHQQDLENLTLTSQPFKTLKLFILAVRQYIRKSAVYLLSRDSWFIPLTAIFVGFGIGTIIVIFEGSREKQIEEMQRYVQFGMWWVALGVASSIGLGSGLHTFVLYLGPHVAFFTIKAMKCGRVDIKSASYDTIQLKRGPSWLGKDCADFGPPLFPSSDGVRIPLSSILPQIQLEAILWGLGTALGELPPYFISRAARLSGGAVDAMEELDASSAEEEGFISAHLTQIKRLFLSHARYLNFFTILILASVPNPLFDLAGIICGQFGIPFWEFFLAMLIGKAIIKTHIQTVFIISVCNNQLLNWMENELLLLSSFAPGFSSVMPNLIVLLHLVKDKYLAAKPHVPSTVKGSTWDLSLTSIWNTVVWMMLINFFVKIVNATARCHLKEQQHTEIDAALKDLRMTEN